MGALGIICVPTAPGAVLVDLDATSSPLGALSVWQNQGSLAGDFISAGTDVPQVVTRDEARGVLLPNVLEAAAGAHYLGPVAPPAVTGSSPRTVEAWVYDAVPQPEKVVIAWGHRGGPDGTNCSIGHGTDPGFGAVAHWGNPGPDLGWSNQLTFNVWSHIAYTFDGTTSRLYRDGELVGSEETPLNTWATDDTLNPVHFRIGRQNSRLGAPSASGIGEIVIGRLRVHDKALTPIEVRTDFDDERNAFGLADPDQDGLPTWFERRFTFLDPNNGSDGAADQDQDGLDNLGEFRAGTDLESLDTDGDGVLDGEEVNRTENGLPAPTNPLAPDTDQDGLTDLQEILFSTDPRGIDSDGDSFMDGQEILHRSNPLDPLRKPDLTIGPALIELDLMAMPLGIARQLPSTGFIEEPFVATSDPGTITVRDGVRGLSLEGRELQYYTGPVVPLFLTGNGSRTIEAWVYNPELEEQETIFSWGRRGGPDGTHCSLNHGNSPNTGAVVHWRQPDLGWRDRASAGTWNHLAYVYSAEDATVRVYSNGTEANRASGVVLNTWAAADTFVPSGLRFRIGCQNDANGAPAPGLRANLTIGRVRVYDRALGPARIMADFDTEWLEFGRPTLNSIQLDSTAHNVNLTWAFTNRRTYFVEASKDLTTWERLGVGIGGRFTVDAPLGSGLRFFRLVVE